MATEQIVVEYVAQVEGLKAQLRTVETALKKVESQGKESAQTVSKSFNTAGSEIKSTAIEIAGALGIAFGVQKVIEFGKESVKAFLEAEVNANKLKFAITKIGGEGGAAFQKLIEQSEKLQQTTIFSDDSIQQSQTMLATLGLNSEQIENIIPKITDLASATGQDLGSATQSIIQGINGQTRGLKAVGIAFDATGDKTKNLAMLTEKLNKFQGASAAALDTTAGKAKRFENAIDNMKETTGEMIVNVGVNILDFFEMFSSGFDKTFNKLGMNALRKSISDSNKLIIVEAEKSEADRLRLISESNKKQIAFANGVKNARTEIQRQAKFELLNNEIELQKELRNLGKVGNGLGFDKDAVQKKADDELKALQKLEDDKNSLIILEDEKATAILTTKYKRDQVAYKGNTEMLLDLEKKYQFDLRQIWLDREAENNKIRKEGEGHALKIFKESAKEMKAEDTELSAGVKLRYDKKVEEAKKSEKEITDNKKQEEENRKSVEDAAFKATLDIYNAYAQIQQNKIQTEINDANNSRDVQIAALDYQLAHKQISEKEYQKKKAAVEKQAAEEERRLKEKAFKAQKRASEINIIISTAEAVIKAIATVAPPYSYILAALATATGAAQLAVVESQPTPKFEKGGKVKGQRHYAGGTLVEAEKDEWIIKRDEAIKNDKLLSAINKGQADNYIYNNFVAPALRNQIKKMNEQKEKSFATNLANSMMFNFKDENLLDSLKMSRRNDKENTRYLASVIEQSKRTSRQW